MAFSEIERLLAELLANTIPNNKTYSYSVKFPFDGYGSVEYKTGDDSFSLLSPFMVGNPGYTLSEPHITGELTQALIGIHQNVISDISISVDKMPNNEFIAYITYSTTLATSPKITILIDGVLYPVDTGTVGAA